MKAELPEGCYFDEAGDFHIAIDRINPITKAEQLPLALALILEAEKVEPAKRMVKHKDGRYCEDIVLASSKGYNEAILYHLSSLQECLKLTAEQALQAKEADDG